MDAPAPVRPAFGRRATGAAVILVTSEVRRRGRTYLFLAAVFTFATAALVVMVGAVGGVLGSIGDEIAETLLSDYRVTRGDPDALAEGFLFNRSLAEADRLQSAIPGARASPRIEFQAVLLHTSRYEDFDTGIGVGVDPERDPAVVDVAGRVDLGRFIGDENLWIDGKPYPQLVVGREMLDALQMRVYNGTLSPRNLLKVSAGRFAAEGGSIRPVVREGVVVGAFETGFDPIDRRVVFMHIATARDVLRIQFDPDPANVILVRAPADAPVGRVAAASGLNLSTRQEFLDSYLHAVFAPLRTFNAVVTAVVLALAGGWVAHVGAQAILAERQRIAVLRALGFPLRLILGPVSGLVIATGVVGAGAGFVLGWLVGVAFDAANFHPAGYGLIEITVDLPLPTAFALLAAVLATAGLAALGAGLALRRIPVTDALRSG